MLYNTEAYLITCLTHLHVGSGGANYGVVDNLVQRDPITKIPVINSSSLKGAIREYFHHLSQKDSTKVSDGMIDYVFGPDDKRGGSKDNKGIGHYKFFEGQMVTLPVRSKTKPFFRATSESILSEVENRGKMLGKEIGFNIVEADKKNPIISSGKDVRIEDFTANKNSKFKDNSHLGTNIAYFHHDDFKKIIKKLPVIARNKLDNGESKNLWYEEIVPRESRFVFFVSKPDNDKTEYSDLFDKIFDGNHVIQIGANASIGYGFTSIKKI